MERNNLSRNGNSTKHQSTISNVIHRVININNSVMSSGYWISSSAAKYCCSWLLRRYSISCRMDNIKKTACNLIDQHSDELGRLSQSIWSKPELAFNEVHAHSELTNYLESRGFSVTRSFKLDTAFRATYRHPEASSDLNVAVLCEYDALPGIGHACGHNLIAEVGVAVALGVKGAMSLADDSKAFGTLTVLGCPAEEGLCGKADMIKLGAFDGIHAALMAHPSQTTQSKPKYVSMTPLSIKYIGKGAHAASFPWEGLNALDAAVMCYNNISCLRQQMKPHWRVHGVIKNGGAQPNIIPEETELEYYLRTPNNDEMAALKQKVSGCVQGAALATGCMVEYNFGEKSYASLLSNNTLAELFEKNARSIGIEFETDKEKTQKFGGSTDMGNVSQIIPSLHPKFFIGTVVSNHSKEFAVAAGDPKAQKYTLDIAKALAMSVLDLYTNKDVMERVQKDFKNDTVMSV